MKRLARAPATQRLIRIGHFPTRQEIRNRRLSEARFEVDLLPRCKIEWVDESAHHTAATRCRQTRERRFSLTDTVSLDCISKHGITEAIAQDEHFTRVHIVLP